MELDLQLTPRSRILIGILGAVLLVLVAIQVVPAFYRLFANQEAKAKQEQLLKTENLVRAAEVLKPVEAEIYKATGLTDTEDQQDGDQKVVSLFDTQPPETVIRARVDGLVKRAGIEQNYQLLTKPAAGKQSLKLTMQNRERLILYLYLKHIEAEAAELTEIAAQEAEDNSFNMMMDAWLSGTTESDTDEKTGEADEASPDTESAEDMDPESSEQSTEPETQPEPSEFAALPEAIPLSLRVKLASYIRSMVTQQLRGATDFRQGFFTAQVHRIETPVSPGIFGIGARPATVEVQLRKNSPLLEILMQTPDEYAEDQPPAAELQSALVQYIEKIQEQRASFLDQLALAPPTYETQLYTVEMKFKTDLEKLVNLNHLIETNAKWLTVRDMRISADKQASNARAQRGRNRGGDNATNLNVDLFLIAQIF